jgi:hypothetical protein
MACDEGRGGASEAALSLSLSSPIAAKKRFGRCGESSIFRFRQRNKKCITDLEQLQFSFKTQFSLLI